MNALSLNLVTFEYRTRRVAACLIFAMGLAAVVISLYSIHGGIELRDEIREYGKRIAQLEVLHAKVAAHGKEKAGRSLGEKAMQTIRHQATVVNQLIVSDVFPWDRVLDSLERALPEGVLLSSLRPSGDRKKIILTGQSKTTESLSRFMSRLDQSGVIDRAALSRLNVEGENGHSGAMAFEIEARLRLAPGLQM
jgi:Tfp pilus assembly protein PilN